MLTVVDIKVFPMCIFDVFEFSLLVVRIMTVPCQKYVSLESLYEFCFSVCSVAFFFRY